MHEAEPENCEQTDFTPEDCLLRSANELVGYHIEAVDGAMGHVEDFILDDEYWTVRYIVVDTRNWLPGKKVLVPPAWIESAGWLQKTVTVDLTKGQVERSPEYDASAPENTRTCFVTSTVAHGTGSKT